MPLLFHLLTKLRYDEAIVMHVAVASSMATIIPTSISSAGTHWRKCAVDLDILNRWANWILIGTLLGIAVASRISGSLLMFVFGVIATGVAAQMLFSGGKGFSGSELPRRHIQRLIALAIGLFSTIMGIGAYSGPT